MFTNLEADMLGVTAHQQYLLSLAHPGHPSLVRQRAGRLLVRFGVWLEGCRPEEPSGSAPVGAMPRLAGGHR